MLFWLAVAVTVGGAGGLIAGGTLAGITLTADDGTSITGTLSPDGQTWTASAAPAYGTTYRFGGSAINDGGSVPVTGGLTAVDPAQLVRASTSIGDGAVVGPFTNAEATSIASDAVGPQVWVRAMPPPG